MSDKAARTHSHISNRAKASGKVDRKVAFKSVLDNPYRIEWPSVPINLQNAVLAHIVSLLEGVAEYQRNRCLVGRKRKRTVLQNDNSRRQTKGPVEGAGGVFTGSEESTTLDDTLASVGPHTGESDSAELSENTFGPSPPLVLGHIVYGINAVTKRLEIQSRNARRSLVFSSDESIMMKEPILPLKYLFVCRADVDPPLLVDHLPHLVAACNSGGARNTLKIVPLPKGAELALAQKLGIRRVTTLGVDNSFPDLSLTALLEPVTALTVPWLAHSEPTQSLLPAHIKQVRTSAPKDMKVIKDARAREKAAAKQRRLSKRQEAHQK